MNDAPVAVADSYSILAGEVLSTSAPGNLTNDFDFEGDSLTVALVSGPSNGVLTTLADGSFVYTPNSGYYGTDTFVYVANDGVLDSAPITVTINVAAVGGSGGGPTDGDGDDDTDTNTDPVVDPDSESQDNNDNDSEDEIIAVAPPTSSNSDNSNPRQKDNSLTAVLLQEQEDAANKLRARSRSEGVGWVSYGSAVEVTRFVSMTLQSIDREALVTELMSDLHEAIVWSDWDKVQEQLESEFDFGDITVGSASVATGVASIVYVMWAIRGGLFAATLCATLPGWRMLDPASLILAYRKNESDSDAVENMF